MKLLREAAGLTQTQLGERAGYGEAQIATVVVRNAACRSRRIPCPARRAGR
ncbi:helix-turn-helix domain-containing protein [Streptomyces massasporeus]|uniref:helix-turn-helix domain-containing protein n=1 Tax=Streptomyces massasporeus TaxID=67324 RepID=UPI0034D3BD30